MFQETLINRIIHRGGTQLCWRYKYIFTATIKDAAISPHTIMQPNLHEHWLQYEYGEKLSRNLIFLNSVLQYVSPTILEKIQVWRWPSVYFGLIFSEWGQTIPAEKQEAGHLWSG